MKNKKVLITGGTGSWGIELVRQLMNQDIEEIRVLARNEFLQFEMSEIFKNPKVKCIIGDIRDRESIRSAIEGVEIIYHLAALKHVPICEDQPLEAIKTNVLGTSNVVEEALIAQVKKVIYLSTDKVAEPSSTYGFTKAIGEKIVLNANGRSEKTQFSILRSGNVLGTHGSVIPVFKRQLEMGQPLKLTHREMTRFFISLEDAVKRLIEVGEVAKGGETFIMKMPSFKILHIAQVMLKAYGKGEEALVEIGPREGEKLSEVLITKEEGEGLYDFNEYLYMLISPQSNWNQETYSLNKEKVGRYSSDEAIVSKEEVEYILRFNQYIG
ncbi:MAG: polysaccharide biosynthesis protein [Cellulosilyticaceae bacterium]